MNTMTESEENSSAPEVPQPRTKRTPAKKTKPAKKASRAKKTVGTKADRSNKKAEMIAQMKRTKSATFAEIMKATGWQPHTVRGVFSGALKKKLGLAVAAAKEERGRVYRITAANA